jgi:superoxide dismutase, Fe-Mn family
MTTKTYPAPTLPYALDALEPHLSRASVENHLVNHHARYVDRTNTLIAGTSYEGLPLDELVRRLAVNRGSELFNNAAQAFNHAFFWRSLKPGGGGKPTGPIAARIDADFGSFDDFTVKFRKAALAVFGSGWIWLVADGDRLKILTTLNANTPLARGLTPILTLDLWEHAYYPDYGARRAAYVEAYLSALANWDFANENIGRAGVKHMIDRTVGPKAPEEATAH